MTFDKAYCRELEINLTAYRARRKYFEKDDNKHFTFECPDKNCKVEFTGVNIYTVGKFKHRPHFRTKKNCSHTKDCKLVIENVSSIDNGDNEGKKAHGTKLTKHPDEFIMERPKQETNSRGAKEYDEDDTFDTLERAPRLKREYADEKNAKPHKTSYLENVVDSFEKMDEQEIYDTYITLERERRNYMHTFKNIKYAEDGTNFIFFGEIKPIKKYGNNYAILFKDSIWFNGGYKIVSIYITKDLIDNYRLRRLFKETIEELSNLGNNYTSAKCYFVGAYPVEETIKGKNGSFTVLNVYIENLDHLVIKFNE
ncbi:hypothetical protein CRV02_04345 [Arcobacter sp. CECT 8989]|uniref:hypothetical protein n=1 Tax=Arcobacter sp. CECT 8989 TaxID=2044509 RepID=UPI00100A7256|nr:hypothetical protein [Arcobacter sp. CECT 8989]RXK02672.1 hypothetical protein CRV02_04345 [Arcobacter sp. CECT 8989]